MACRSRPRRWPSSSRGPRAGCGESRRSTTGRPPPLRPPRLRQSPAASPVQAASPARGRARRLRLDVEVAEGSPVPAVRGFLVLKRLEGAGSIASSSPAAEELRAGRMPGRTLTVELDTGQSVPELERTLAQIADLSRVEIREVEEPPPVAAPPPAPRPEGAAEPGPYRAGPRRDARRVPRRLRRAPARDRAAARARPGHARGGAPRPRGGGRPAPGHRQGPARPGHVGAHDPAHRALRPPPPRGPRPGAAHRQAGRRGGDGVRDRGGPGAPRRDLRPDPPPAPQRRGPRHRDRRPADRGRQAPYRAHRGLGAPGPGPGDPGGRGRRPRHGPRRPAPLGGGPRRHHGRGGRRPPRSRMRSCSPACPASPPPARSPTSRDAGWAWTR